ncbi:MAG: hypothetical protein VCD00_11535 [Candidatus Hydrogenedentota bacterium]
MASDEPPKHASPVPRVVLATLLIVAGLAILIAQPTIARITGFDALTESSLALIDESMLDNQKTFLVFSAIKASLALIEGSTVGVGIEVQVGDLIQPAYDYVDFFWKVFLYAFVILGSYKILLETGLLTLGFPLIGIGCLIMATSVAFPTTKWNATLLARNLMLIGLLVCYVLPLSLLATDELSVRYVDELKEQHRESISQFNTQLESTQDKFLAVKGEISILKPAESIDRVQNAMVVLMQSIAETFQLTLMSFMYFVLIVLFELLVLPLSTALVLYLVSKRILNGIGTPRIQVVKLHPSSEIPA